MIDLWAVGRYDLGLSEKSFWELTLKEFDALCRRKRINDRKIEYPSAQIACLLFNIHRGDQKAKGIEDFMAIKEIDSGPGKTIQTSNQMKNIAKIITAAFKGEIK